MSMLRAPMINRTPALLLLSLCTQVTLRERPGVLEGLEAESAAEVDPERRAELIRCLAPNRRVEIEQLPD